MSINKDFVLTVVANFYTVYDIIKRRLQGKRMSDFRISNGYFHLWRTFLQSQQIDWQALNLSEQHHLQLQHIFTQTIDAQSSLTLFNTLIEWTQQKFHLSNLILEMAKCISPANFGVLGYMTSRSESVAEAIDYVMRFHRLIIDGDEMVPMHVEHSDTHIRLYWPLMDSRNILLCELTLAAMVQLARQIISPDFFFLQSVELVNSPRVPQHNYQQFFQCPIQFQQTFYALTLARNSLSVRPEQADAALVQLLVRQAETVLAQRTKPIDLIQHVECYIADYLQTDQRMPSIEQLAIASNLSVRTLQRQLLNMGTSFKQILDQVMVKRCDTLLLEQYNLASIAERLGYADQSSLGRAFKNITGQTLLQRKKMLLKNPQKRSSAN